jgi:hypothetical protein
MADGIGRTVQPIKKLADNQRWLLAAHLPTTLVGLIVLVDILSWPVVRYKCILPSAEQSFNCFYRLFVVRHFQSVQEPLFLSGRTFIDWPVFGTHILRSQSC